MSLVGQSGRPTYYLLRRDNGVNIYRLALQVQDASNISGVINSLNTQIMPAIRAEVGYAEQGMPYVEQHPVLLLFLDKIVSLTRAGWIHDHDSKISDAYSACHKMADFLEARVGCPECGVVGGNPACYYCHPAEVQS